MDSQYIQASSLEIISVQNVWGDFHIYTARQSEGQNEGLWKYDFNA